MLAVIETHPIQYHAPVYRALQHAFGVPVTAIYGSDFSVAGYHDREFGVGFAWDTDLLSGYSSIFLSHVASGGAADAESVRSDGLRQALAQLHADAVMVVGYSPRFHRVAWFEAKRTGRPVIFRGETSDDAQERPWVKGQMRATALSLAYRTCDRLLYIGQRSREHFLRHGVPEARLVFSPYCVDVTPFETGEDDRARLRPAVRAELGVGEDEWLILYSGKLSHRKGVDLIIDAVRVLPPNLRERSVVAFLGDGDLRAVLEASARQRPEVRVAMLGFQNQTRLSRYYQAADVLVLPSRHSETWGLVVNEALHHGLPCVVSDRVGCLPDLIAPGVTGASFPSESAELLSSAIAATAPSGREPRVRQACRDKVAAYSVKSAAAGIATAYAAALDERRATA